MQIPSLFSLILRCISVVSLTMLTYIATSESFTSLYARHLMEYDGRKILQSEIQTFNNLTKIDCLSACSREKYCVSFHFYPGGPTCVTMRERFNNVTVTSTAVPGYQLFQTDKPLPTVGSDCELDVDCKSLLNSHCHQGSCRCDVGHRPDGNTCRNYTASCVSSPGYTWDADTDMCYRIETQVKKSWADAERACTINQGHLVRPDTATKNDKLREHLQQLSADLFWIGARYDHVTKKWQWFDNTTITSPPWAPGEPSGDGSCVDLQQNLQFKWNDKRCTLDSFYICEMSMN